LVTDSIPVTVNAGSHTLSEDGLPGYAMKTWGGDCNPDGSITLAPGQDATCTLTNDDLAPSLTLVKAVTKDNGGTAVPADWTLTASGPTGFSGSGDGVSSDVGFDAGTYNLSESGPTGYAPSAWVCEGVTQDDADTVTLGLGQSATCTITNDDLAPTLTVVKKIINDNGGTATADDFSISTSAGNLTFSASGGSGTAGDPYVYTSNTLTNLLANQAYTLAELNLAGYSEGTWSCAPNGGGGSFGGGSVTLTLDEDATCVITNDDVVLEEVIFSSGFESQ
jgi:hypothetical protein